MIVLLIHFTWYGFKKKRYTSYLIKNLKPVHFLYISLFSSPSYIKSIFVKKSYYKCFLHQNVSELLFFNFSVLNKWFSLKNVWLKIYRYHNFNDPYLKI